MDGLDWFLFLSLIVLIIVIFSTDGFVVWICLGVLTLLIIYFYYYYYRKPEVVVVVKRKRKKSTKRKRS